jgi:alpha-glucosidase
VNDQPGTTLGPLQQVSIDGHVAEFDFGGPRLAITLHDRDFVRVRFTPRQRPPRRSWSVLPPDDELDGDSIAASEREDGQMAVAGSDLSVSVHPCGGGLEVAMADGGLPAPGALDGGPTWDDTTIRWTGAMPDGVSYFGFGERTGPLDKRGRRYTCWATDRYEEQGPGTDELYLAIPFMVALDPAGVSHGVFLNSTWRSAFDLTSLHDNRYTIETGGPELDLFLLMGPDPAAVLDRYTRLTGRIPLPPRWALGYQQARWSYAPEATVRDIAAELRTRHIPADSIGLDIDYMDCHRVFTWDQTRFPDPAGLMTDLRRQGFKTVAVVDCGVKAEPGYPVWEEGLANDYFVAAPDGPPFHGYVWPGLCAFPDFTQPAVRRWWGDWYRVLLDAGVGGVLNDMNEPAIHDSPMDAPGSRRIDPPPDARHGASAEPATHAEVHNVYALLEAEAAHDAIRRRRADERTLLVTRSGFAGIQRHAAVWTGDNASYWEHLEMSLPQLLNLGVSGVPLAGADIGGFFADCGPELLVRWMQLGAFYPLMRSNNAKDCQPQEPWAWGRRVEGMCRRAIELRYRLLPYLYTCVAAAHVTGAPILRPLWWHHAADGEARQRDDEALLGPDLLVAPVVRPGRSRREVYLPQGRWYDWRTGQVHLGPAHVLVSAALDEDPPLFARAGSIVPIGPVMQWSDERPMDPLTLEVFLDEDGRAHGSLYEDDGRTHGYERGESCITTYRCEGPTVTGVRSGPWSPEPRTVVVRVHGPTGVVEHRVAESPSWRIAWA